MAETEGWGQDFDEDGNVIGEMPDEESGNEPGFIKQRKLSIGILTAIQLLPSLPGLAATTSGVGGLIGALFGGAIMAFLVSVVVVFVWVKFVGGVKQLGAKVTP